MHVVAGGDVLQPLGVIEIPTNGEGDAFFELEGGLPTEFAVELGGVDGIAQVVSLTVGNEGDEATRCAGRIAEQAIDGIDDDMYKVDVAPLVESAYIVGVGNCSTVENKVDGASMVLDVKPVAHIVTRAVNGKWATVTDIVDEQRDEFLRELVRSVIVGTVGDNGGHTVGIVKGANKMVARCLACRIGAVWAIRGLLGEERVVEWQCAVNLVGGYVVEQLAGIAFGERLPVLSCSLQERECTHDIGLSKGERVAYAAIDVAFGGKVYNAVDMVMSEDCSNGVEVANISSHKGIVGRMLYVGKIGKVAGIGELVEVDNVIFGVLVYEKPHDMRADKPGTAGDEYIAFIHCSGCLYRL